MRPEQSLDQKMKRSLSSQLTGFFKVIPALWIPLVGLGVLGVSNYLKEISIPLTDISEVTALDFKQLLEKAWLNYHPVTVHLKRSSAFGNRITFMPEFDISSFGSSHPVVAELRKFAQTRRSTV